MNKKSLIYESDFKAKTVLKSRNTYCVLLCPRSSNPFYIVTYWIKWALLLGHTVNSLILQSYIGLILICLKQIKIDMRQRTTKTLCRDIVRKEQTRPSFIEERFAL